MKHIRRICPHMRLSDLIEFSYSNLTYQVITYLTSVTRLAMQAYLLPFRRFGQLFADGLCQMTWLRPRRVAFYHNSIFVH